MGKETILQISEEALTYVLMGKDPKLNETIPRFVHRMRLKGEAGKLLAEDEELAENTT